MSVSRLSLLAILALSCASCSSSDGPPPSPPSAAWPKFRQNVNNTGNGVAPIAQTTPTIVWSLPVDAATPKPVSSSPAIAIGGRIYVGSEGGTLLAVDSTGQPGWRTNTCSLCPTPLGPIVSSPLVFTYNNVNSVYVATMDGRMVGFQDNGTSATCTMCFSPTAYDPTVTDATIATSPTLTSHPITGLITGIFIGATVQQAGAQAGKVYALNTDGSVQWQFPDPTRTTLPLGPLSASPALSFTNTLYVVSDEAVVYAMSLGGSLLWNVPLARSRTVLAPAATSLYPSPVTTSDLLLASSPEGNILALTLGGTLAWRAASEGTFATSLAIGSQAELTPTATVTGLPTSTPMPTGAATQTPSPTPTPVLVASTAFGVTENGTLVVRDLRDGTRLAPSGPPPTPILGAVRSSPALSADQYLIFGTATGLVYVLDTADGTPLAGWPISVTGGATIRSSPSISENGTIYVGADNGILYAIGKQ